MLDSDQTLKSSGPRLSAAALSIGLALGWGLASPAAASDFAWDFRGSLGPGKHQRYVPAVSNPLFNETPYITTEVRPIYLHHDISDEFLTGGGEIDLWAVEFRIALTERLGFIATKDGYADADFDAVLPDDTGFANLAAGFKYAVLSNPADASIASVGIKYEAPTGSLETAGIDMQGEGDGFVNVFATGAKAFGLLGLQASLGVNLAIDGDHNSSLFHYSVHADYEIAPGLYPLVEINGLTTIDDGNRTVGDFEGVDVVNFGSTDSGTVATIAAGARYRLTDHIQFGAAYEAPITDREDIFDWRIYVDAVLSY